MASLAPQPHTMPPGPPGAPGRVRPGSTLSRFLAPWFWQYLALCPSPAARQHFALHSLPSQGAWLLLCPLPTALGGSARHFQKCRVPPALPHPKSGSGPWTEKRLFPECSWEIVPKLLSQPIGPSFTALSPIGASVSLSEKLVYEPLPSGDLISTLWRFRHRNPPPHKKITNRVIISGKLEALGIGGGVFPMAPKLPFPHLGVPVLHPQLGISQPPSLQVNDHRALSGPFAIYKFIKQKK